MPHLKPIAKTDINVVKFIKVTSSGELYSPCYDTQYHINERMPSIALHYVRPYSWRHPNTVLVGEGYHSHADGTVEMSAEYYGSIHTVSGRLIYENFWNSTSPFPCGPDDLIIPYECVIPKGTMYYKNKYGWIVSETIIVKKPHPFVTPLEPDPLAEGIKKRRQKVKDYYTRLMERFPDYIIPKNTR